MPKMRGLWIAAAILVCAWGKSAQAEVSEARARVLAEMVHQDCGSCHGMTLKGGLGLPLTREALAEKSEEGLFYVIRDGMPGTAMPPWQGMLSDADIRWIARYLVTGEKNAR